jgi:hypothetical protein
MRQYLVEITFLLYGLYLLHELQYLSLLILLVLSLILIMKGIQHKESLVITMVILLFITQYHRYFPSRNNINNEMIIQENFKSKSNSNDKKMIIEKAERKKKRNERKKLKQRLEKEIAKSNSGLPIRYIKNKLKIDETSSSWGDSLSKWYLFKENFFILLNNDDD